MQAKLCLGTVQLGVVYGINNTTGIPVFDEIRKIFSVAKQSHIDMLDTAHGYGDSESKIGEFSNWNYKIVTKFSKVKNGNDLYTEMKVSLDNLKTDVVYGYMAHSADTLIQNPELWKTLNEIKQKKIVQKIGYSLYSPNQLQQLLDLNLIPDIVQLPYSVLDRKFENFLPLLKKQGTEIHVRSVFLQGLYFMDPLKLPVKLDVLKPQLQELHNCCDEFNVEIGSLALNFAIRNDHIDKVVIGVESATQLQKNINTIQAWENNEQLMNCINKIEINNIELLNPANW